MKPRDIDYAPLASTPDKNALEQVRQEAMAGAFGASTSEFVTNAKQNSRMAVGVIGGLITGVFAVVTLIQWIQGADGSDLLIAIGATVIVAILSIGAYLLDRRVVQPRAWRRSVRLVNFARANDLDVELRAGRSDLPGMLAGHRSANQMTYEKLSWTQHGLSAESALHTDASYGRTANTFSVRYLAVRLPVTLPRMTFDCGRQLPHKPDMHFGNNVLDGSAYPDGRRLTCPPPEAERARMFFTDELMTVLTDKDFPATAEVDDGWFLAYYGAGHRLDPRLWQRTFEAVDAVAHSCRAFVRP